MTDLYGVLSAQKDVPLSDQTGHVFLHICCPYAACRQMQMMAGRETA